MAEGRFGGKISLYELSSRVLHCQIFNTTSSDYHHLWGKIVELGWLKMLTWTVCHAVETMCV